MNIAIIGTGFVADYYMTTLKNYPQLNLLGVYDHNAERLATFCQYYNLQSYKDYQAMLDDQRVDIIVNLTTPENHFNISLKALQANKHVYSEKPLAMSVEEAEILVKTAREKNLTIAGAPANALSSAHQLVKDNIHLIGTPRLIYAEMEDGPVFRDKWASWQSISGAPWPGLHEFEIGSTLEHAGYGLSWLISLFGPVRSVTAFSAITFPDKGKGTEHLQMAPDFSVGCLTFRSGCIARITCGLAMPRNRALIVVGDKGSLTVDDLWDDRSVVRLEIIGEKRSFITKLINQLEPKLGKFLHFRPAPGRKLAYNKTTKAKSLPAFPSQIDFAKGIADQALAIKNNTSPFFAGDVSLHITEIALALNNANQIGQPYQPRSTF